MSQFVKFLIPLLIILLGVLLKLHIIPNSDSVRKYWWMLVLIGSMNLLFKIILYFINLA
jgi:hypothetical protein